MDVVWLKLILLLVMIILTIVAGLVPLKVLRLLRKSAAVAATSQKQRLVSLSLCLLTCFSGGVFLATCFLHLLPEVHEQVQMMQEKGEMTIDYPVAEALSCAGFFLIFFLEEIVLIAVPGLAHSHNAPDLLFHDDHGHAHFDDHAHDHHEHGCTPTRTKSTDEDENGEVTQSTPADAKDARSALITNRRATHHGVSPCNGIRSRVTSPEVYSSLALAEPERCETNCARDEDPPILMASRPHAHSHGVRSFTFVLALSFHSIIEGLAFGVSDSSSEVWTLFLSLIVHKVIVAFSVGLQLARTHAHGLHWVIASVCLLAMMSPLGAVIGIFVQNSAINTNAKDFLILIFQGLAVGTFLYVTFFEVLLHERDNEHPNLLKLLVIIIGFTLIGSLRLFDHGHSHTHGEIGTTSDP